MGVHELWSIVEPVRESVPLYSLSGKTLAVDLSLWVCEAQHVQAMMGRVMKPHLRNLFFRVSSLTLMGLKLVFVMEGEAPKLKSETMRKRTETRYGGFRKAPAPKSASHASRGRFNAVLRECAEMLDYLGVPWVTAAGEAEAMCAYLDSQGLVDGCITNDGDAFLYGARTVYRNFNMNSKDPHVDCYQTSRVHSQLHLCRENLVGLAILLGCDYIPKGIPGVGREQALKFIQTLKGQSLLERFIQWKEDNTDLSNLVVKKVPHCNICRHPGSSKAHERGGCVLCDSRRFCQPQDFDYQCPCDWHRHEHTRQVLSLEANIRRKILASQQFPFTEIIREFLISKDKSVSQFKRRQPNLLSMQKFAFKKMEWPAHYTSEKVLVLMTYTELMNQKYGRDVPPQIKPVRILKPRVRNAVACFEVIWSTPEHFVFPEDRAAEDQQEVRTVEEESLFRVAFPEIVETFMRSKALAEESKTKKKKPKCKKEKASDVSDGVSDLFAQMNIHSSSSASAVSPPQPLLANSSKTDQTDVLILDTINQKQPLKENEDGALSGAEPEAVASQSVSAVIEALHLSDINWDALSFTSSPASQVHHIKEPQQKTTPEADARPGSNTDFESFSSVKQADHTSAPKLCYTECPLRERVLMRNGAKATNQMEKYKDEVSQHLNYELASPEIKPQGKPSGHIPSNVRNVSEKECVFNKIEPLSEKSQFEIESLTSTERQIPAQKELKERSNVSKKPPQKYKFVRTAQSSSSASTQRCLSDPGQSSKKDTHMLQTTKKSVCMSVCSSSEDSDAENQHSGPQRQTKAKRINTIRGSFISKFPLKPISAPKTTESNEEAPHTLQNIGPRSKCHTEVVGNISVSTKHRCQDVQTAMVDVATFPQSPVSPVITLDSDDSVICSDSPLPLAERLKLKFLK
ncbi:flap endonuclease GEN homolog 1 [Menidia menidia]